MPIGIDLFSGAGGLSLGAEMAGFQVKFAVEKDKSAAMTYRHNHPNTLVLEDDIHNIDPWEHLLPNEHVSIIFGGPPCQGFSFSNTMSRNMDNPNNSLFEEFLRFVNEIQPDWFLFENVEGFVHFKEGKILHLVEQRFKDMGYQVFPKVLWASDYGVPQHRNRFFMVGNRFGIKFEYPKPFGTKITVNDAIGDLPECTAFWDEEHHSKKKSHEAPESGYTWHKPRYHNTRDMDTFKLLAEDIESGKIRPRRPRIKIRSRRSFWPTPAVWTPPSSSRG